MTDCELCDEMTLSASIAFGRGVYHSNRKLSKGEGLSLLLAVGAGEDWPRQVRTTGDLSAVEQGDQGFRAVRLT